MSQRLLNGTGSDTVMLVDATAGSEVVPLPRGFATGRKYTARRLDGSGNDVTVTPPVGDYVDGVLNAVKAIGANGEMSFVPLEVGRWESFGAGAVGGSVADGEVTTAKVADAAITAAKCGPDVATQAELDAESALRVSGLAGKAAIDFANVTPATGRTALGLGGAAVLSVGTSAGTVAAGDDARLSDTRTPTNGSVTLAKIPDATITPAKLSFDVATQAELDAVAAAKADKTTSVIAGTGLSGGGTLAADRTLNVVYGTSSTTAARGDDSRITGAAPKAGAVYTGTHDFTGATVTGVTALAEPTIYAAASPYNVVGDSNGSTGNGTDNTAGMRAAYAACIALVTVGTGGDYVYPTLVLPHGVIRVTDSIVTTPDAAGAAVAPIRGLHWRGCGREATEIFFDKTSSATEDPRLNNLFILGNRAASWSFEGMSFRSLDPDNSCFFFWCRDADDAALVFPEYGTGFQNDIRFRQIGWRGAWKRAIGWGGDHQSNLNSEFRFDECYLSNESTFADAAFHLGLPMYGAVHMRVTGSATGGTYTITVGANTTSALAYNASAATIQTALRGLASVGAGNATVTAVSDGFLLRFTGAAESLDTTTVSATPSLTGGTNPSVDMYRRPLQMSQFLNYWLTNCEFELAAGVVWRNGRGGNINVIGGSWIGVDPAQAVTFFKLENESEGYESCNRLMVQGVRFEIRGAPQHVIDCGWNKGSVSFISCMDSAFSYLGFAATHATHMYDFTTQGLSRGPMVTYRDCEAMGMCQVTTHASVAVSGGSVSYENTRFMNNTAATGTSSGMIRYSGVTVPYRVTGCHNSSYNRIADSSSGW